MLSIKKLKNAKAASRYFEKDDYYAKDDPQAQKESQWFGKTVAVLGLSGEVDKAQFERLLSGNLPNGLQLGRVTQDGIVHAPGWDFTFSAPKSLSILVELGGDNRLRMAHEQAVKNALSYLEENAVMTRLSVAGTVQQKPTKNLAAALFTHHTSRAQDPQLHTHAVIINATQIEKGEFRSIESHEMYQRKMLAGMLYRSELAYAARQLGYEVKITHSDGRFELAAVPQEVIRAFSSRRASIEKGLETSFVKDALAAERVALNTRPNKKVDDRAELKVIWQEQAKQLDFVVDKVLTIDSLSIHKAQDKDRKKDHRSKETIELAMDAVKYGAAKLANREAVFTTEQLIAEAMVHSLGEIRLPDVLRATETLSTAGFLLATRLGETPAWTTKRALFLEKAVLSIMHTGKESVKAMYDRIDIDNSLKTISFTPGQQAAAVAILSSTDRIMGIQGYAGTGKTFMLNTVRQYAEKSGYTVLGFGPSATAAHELQESANIESKTLASHLLMNKSILETLNKRQVDFSRQLWVVDESSMTSTQDMFDVLKLSELTGARVVLVGDTKQLGAIEAGKPFKLLQKAGMHTVVMKDILRQRTKQALLAVLNSIDGKIQQAINILGNQVKEIENREERLKAIANHYLTLKPEDRKDTIVLAPANDDRHELNALIRNGLRKERIVQGEEKQVPIFVKQGFTPIEKSRASNYTPGMVIRFTKDYRSLGVVKDTHANVQHIHKTTGIVTLKTSDGKIIEWNPTKLGAGRRGGVEVYSMETRELAAGDRIRWTSNNKNLGVHNSELADVVQVSDKGIHVRCKGNDELTLLKPENPTHRHFEYAYTSTVYVAQGKTSVGIIMNGEHFRRFLTNTKTFYTGLSRAKENMHVYVSDRSKYINAVQKNLGEKTSALESLLCFHDDKSPYKDRQNLNTDRGKSENESSLPLNKNKKNRLKELVSRNREKELQMER